MKKLHWYETFKIDENIEDDILSTINKITKDYKNFKEKNNEHTK